MIETAHEISGASIDELLLEVRAQIERISPEEAYCRLADGALLVDVRPCAQRRADGEILGAVVIERNVLEWRLDPTCPHHHPAVTDAEQEIVVFCQEGYASSLAILSLNSIGLRRVFDLDGGYLAWRKAGLPTVRSKG